MGNGCDDDTFLLPNPYEDRRPTGGPGHKTPRLVPIKLPITAQDARIKPRQLYLVKYAGSWSIGVFSKQWYGWNFDGHYDAGIQVDYPGWQACFEFHEKPAGNSR